jgi:hypothetical protein
MSRYFQWCNGLCHDPLVWGVWESLKCAKMAKLCEDVQVIYTWPPSRKLGHLRQKLGQITTNEERTNPPFKRDAWGTFKKGVAGWEQIMFAQCLLCGSQVQYLVGYTPKHRPQRYVLCGLCSRCHKAPDWQKAVRAILDWASREADNAMLDWTLRQIAQSN